MTVQADYNLTLADILEYRRYHRKIGPRNARLFGVIAVPKWLSYGLLVIVVAACFVGLIRVMLDDAPFLARMTALLITLFFTLGLFIPLWERRRLRKWVANLGNIRMEASEDKIIIDQELSHQELAWRFFMLFAESENLYLLYYRRGMNALLVPKRAFGNQEDALAFRNLAQPGITRAQGFPVQPTPIHE